MTIHAQIKRQQYDILGRVLIGSLIAIAAALIPFSGTLPSSAGNPSVEVLATPKATATLGGPELAELEATFTVGDIGQFAHPPSVSVQRVEPDGTVVILDEGFEGAWPPPDWAAQPNWGDSCCRASAGSKSALLIGLLLAMDAAHPAKVALAQGSTIRYVNCASDTDSGDCTASPCKTIGYALSQANNGDTIRVAACTYTESLTLAKPVSLIGDGAEDTIIHALSGQRVLTINGATITNSTVISGFTITGGVAPTTYNTGGGALIEDGASPTFIGNEITGNTALNGAGIAIWSGASPVISDNVITGNSTTTGGPGGGIYVFNSWPAIISNTIAGNAGTNGGGIHARAESYPTIVNNTIVSNTVSGDGGGIWIGGWGSYATGGILTGNTIRANTATYGGGIQIETNSSVTLSSNTILSNTVDQNGGGIYVTRNSSLISSDDIIAHNTASDSGGGLAIDDNSLATMSGATISDNRGDEYGGGISTPFWRGDCDLRLSNSIVERNTTGSEGGGIFIGQDSSATVQATTIVSNSAGKGGGIYLDGNASFIGNTITGNVASGSTYSSHGGGIYAYANASFTLSCNTILSNTADHDGGGIYTNDVISPTLRDNIIQSNVAENGGGIYADRSEQLTFSGNIIADNTAVRAGGIYFDNSAGILNNNIIARNASSTRGGGIYVYSNVSCTPPCPTAPTVSNNTIVANNVSGTGEGIYVYIYSSDRDAPVITNNIIVSNTYGVSWHGAGSEDALLYNDVWGNSEADYDGVTPGPGSISADPLFVSGPHGEYYLSQLAAGQDVDSPCVDAGSDTAANLGLDDRTTRTDEVPDSGTVDMGYHFDHCTAVTTPTIYLPIIMKNY